MITPPRRALVALVLASLASFGCGASVDAAGVVDAADASSDGSDDVARTDDAAAERADDAGREASEAEPCAQRGALCRPSGWTCQCGDTGRWACVMGEDAPPRPALPLDVYDGAACDVDAFACSPAGICGGECHCQGGTWHCAAATGACPYACPDLAPVQPATCAAPGLVCVYLRGCPPTCVCGLDGLWTCLMPPC